MSINRDKQRQYKVIIFYYPLLFQYLTSQQNEYHDEYFANVFLFSNLIA